MFSFIRERFGSRVRPILTAGGRLLALGLAATVLCLAGRADCQVLYGTLTGNVTDQTSTAAAGVKVQALNVGTNVAKSSDHRRPRRLPVQRPPARRLRRDDRGARASRPSSQKGVKIDTNAVRRVDARLEVSGVTETVEVTAAAAPLQTDRADVHVTQTAKQVNDLPLAGSLGRNYQSLMQVVPGAVDRADRERARRGQLHGRQPAAVHLLQRQRRVGLGEPDQDRRLPRSRTSGCRPTPRTCPRPRRSKR